jgi:3-hydroxyisobutyrate dehydrogenase-like beta-hydroxyacid dehydrogenase
MEIAFLGLGRMGRELVAHVIKAGHHVTVWNRSPRATAQIATGGVVAAETAATAVAHAEIVVTTLFGPDAVREVIIEPDVAFAGGALWIDVTTIAPADATAFAAWAEERGVTYVHSPVVGSLVPARAGTLGVLVGSSLRGVEAALPIVTLWADPQRLHTFDAPAKAAASKLVANLAVATTMQAFAEALSLGHGGGLTTDEVLTQLLDKTPLQTIAILKGDAVRSGAFVDTQFSANALAKDAALMLRTAEGPLPSLSVAYEALAEAQAAGLGEYDFSVIAKRAR